jgi:hypothetical protein
MSLAGTFLRLAAYLGTPLSVQESEALIRQRMERREALFLSMLRERCFVPSSPYRQLLDAAGCEYGDLELMVRQRGIESSLDALRRSGVYLSFEEFKRGGDVRRGRRVFRVCPDQFDARGRPAGMALRSGGTRSSGTWIALPIEHLAATHTPQVALTLAMLVQPDTPILTWQLGYPSGAGVAWWFSLAKLRRPAERWFSLSEPPRRMGGRYHFMFNAGYAIARLARVRVPSPEYVPVDRVADVLRVVRAATARAGSCAVVTTPNCAVRLAGEAMRDGISLRGVTFLVGGEPLTEGKVTDIARAGARVASHYSVTEAGGSVGAPCGAGEPGDMHARLDAFAVIPNRCQAGHATVDALMLTSLLPTAPKVLLNVETDDFGEMTERPCGCRWDALGCRLHLRHLRSFTKLTGEGTTVLGTNCEYVIEQVLPHAFGGSSVDYQLVEAEDEQHVTRLYLLVSPKVGHIDEETVRRRFADALRRTADNPLGGFRSIWDQAGSVRVVRRDPILTGAGKLMPFHTLGAGGLSPASNGRE